MKRFTDLALEVRLEPLPDDFKVFQPDSMVTNFLGSDEIVNNKETNDENYSSTKFFLIRYTVFSFIFYFLFQNKAIGDVCLPNPCENGGLCHHGVDGKLFSCECPHGFLGLRCECKFLLFSFSCVYMVTW